MARQQIDRRPVLVLPRLDYIGRFHGAQDSLGEDRAATELMCVTEGSVDVELGALRAHGGAGCCFVYPRHSRPRKVTAGMRTTFIFFDAPASCFSEDARMLRFTRGEVARRWIEDLCDLYHAPGGTPPELLGALLRAILERLSQIDERHQAAVEVHPALALAAAAIQGDPCASLSVAAVADRVGISGSHLAALFRGAFGCGPLGYQQRLRLERAERLLRDPYLTVQEVAKACGYQDANYFLRLFRKRRGVAPGTWRKQSRSRTRTS